MKRNYSIETIRHSLSHLMALAVKRLYPKVLFGIGPAIENGFYYDFEIFDRSGKKINLCLADLAKIEAEMKKIIKEDLPFKKKELSLKEAEQLFKKLDQKYKLDLINDLKKYGTTDPDEISKMAKSKMKPPKTISVYEVGDFIDLCRGPHVKSSGELPLAFKLTKVAGAYWRGRETNPMMDRLMGLAFETEKELKDYLAQIEEAEKRDHRLLGETLDLYHIDDDLGPGLILWHPNGALIKRLIENYALDEYLKNGYFLVNSPHIARFHLWEISGHSGFYKESMYPPMHLKEINKEERDDYQLKPMNCPFHILIYKHKVHSWRDLPLRFTELGTVYRYERSGTLSGLVRVRGFTQDDAHIWCQPEQLETEIKNAFFLALKILKTFGFEQYEIYLSTRPEKYIGRPKDWQLATKAIEETLRSSKINYLIDKGGGAFYGPKIDIKIKDALGRPWQCTTIQIDFNLPQRFDLYYIDKKGKKQRPIMIHRALLGSLERFMGVLIEHYKGAFPLWLAPSQVALINVGKSHRDYAAKIFKLLSEKNIRCRLLEENETVNKRIRQAEMEKIPYILVVGDREKANQTVSVRRRKSNELKSMAVDEFISQIIKEIENKVIF